jgi:uncharacterized repeat protein (TIGR01451 family)
MLIPALATFTGCGSDDPVAPSTTVDVAITKSVDNGTPTEGSDVVFSVVVSNGGPGDASAVAVTDSLPPGLTYQSGTATQGTYDPVTGVWDVGDVANAGSATLTLTVTVDEGTGGTMITNRAALTGVTEEDSNSGNDSDTADIAPQNHVLVLAPFKDNTLYESAGGALSNGVGEFMFAGRTDAAVLRRALMAFDVSALPANAIVESVELTLNMSKTARPDPFNFTLHRVLADWGEGTSDAGGRIPTDGGGGGAASTTGDATWVHRLFNFAFWNNPGGDFDAFEAATVAVGTLGLYTWSGNGLRADVEFWRQNPAQNFGWMLRGNELTNKTAKRFDTHENGDGTGPRLVITYALP